MQVIQIAVRCALIAAVAVTGAVWFKSSIIGPTTAASKYNCLPPYSCGKDSDRGVKGPEIDSSPSTNVSSSGSTSDSSSTTDSSSTGGGGATTDSSHTEEGGGTTDSSSTNDSLVDAKVDWEIEVN